MTDARTPIEGLDTGRGLLVNRLFGLVRDADVGRFRIYVLPYLVTAIACFVIPLVIACLTMNNLTRPRAGELSIPYLLDWNMIFCFLVSLPLLVMLSVSEPRLISSGLAKLEGDKVLGDWTKGELHKRWSVRYFVVNIVAQLAGIVVGAAAGYINYRAQTVCGFRGWQFDHCGTEIASWILLLWQIPLLGFFCAVYLVRFVSHIWFLYDLVKECNVTIQPFHHDHCGGLWPIGRLGVRNQYIMAAMGINILLFQYALYQLGSDAVEQRIEASEFNVAILMVACVSVYLVGAPTAFLGPLLPFRDKMRQSKESMLVGLSRDYEKVYDRVKKNCTNVEEAEADVACIERIDKLRNIVERLPVWPLDTRTLRNFFIAIGTPLISALMAGLVSLIIHWAKGP